MEQERIAYNHFCGKCKTCPEEAKIIDTPGIRELGLVDISKQELSHYMPEMRAFRQAASSITAYTAMSRAVR